jgi:thioredoxin:protein disulfide reductase
MRRFFPTQAAAIQPFLLVILAFVGRPAWAQPQGIKVDAKWAFATDAVHPGDTVHAGLIIKLEKGFHVQSNKPLDDTSIPTELKVTPPTGITVREIVYPKPVMFDIAGDRAAVFEESFVIGIALDVAANVKPGTSPVSADLHYQACNDKNCLAPATLHLTTEVKVVAPDAPITKNNNPALDGIPFSSSPAPIQPPTPQDNAARPSSEPAKYGCDVMATLSDFTILGTTGGFMGANDFVTFINDAETGTVRGNMLEGKGPLAIILLVVIGGVLLNLTPCVLPLIPINLAIIGAGTRAGSRARGFALGGTYGLAMAAVYGVLGLVVILTTSTFGTINGTIWFNVGIAILFVVLALAMFDVIHIDFTKYQSNIDASSIAKSGTFALAFVMGGVSALLAGACVAPVVIQVIVYSSSQYARGTHIALALPFFLGLGMALPWPFAGTGLSLLPKPGMWMVRVKQGMGVFILAFAAYYGYLAWEIWDSKHVDPAAVQSAVQAQLAEGWMPVCEGLAKAKVENKPVLIDMWATWCKNCKTMDITTLKDPDVLKRLDGYVKIKFQAEDLSAPPASDAIALFKGVGLPTYAILKPKAPSQAAALSAPRGE